MCSCALGMPTLMGDFLVPVFPSSACRRERKGNLGADAKSCPGSSELVQCNVFGGS